MRRFVIDRVLSPGMSVSISGAEARHMVRVLRLRPGDRVVLMDAGGARFQGAIQSMAPRGVRVYVEVPLPGPPPSPVEIILCQAVLKSRPMDFVVQKASELGVNRIIPFFSARTVVRLDEKRHDARLHHWKEITRSSAKQADRRAPAAIDPVRRFDDLMKRLRKEAGMKIILWEEEDTLDLKRVFRETKEKPGFRTVIGVVGPEGGFASDEIHLAGEAGFVPVSLGHRILRAETAAITLTALVQYEWGDLGRTGLVSPLDSPR